jgi:fatty acid desaturase
MNNFRKDKNYLLRYAIISLAIFLTINALLLHFKGIHFTFSFKTVDYFLPLSVIFMFGFFGSLIHGCSHGAIKPRLLNNIIGELCGVLLLYGFREFTLFHLLHHISPDDPEADPQPAVGFSMLHYFLHPIQQPFKAIGHAYFSHFGKNKDTIANLKWQKILISCVVVSRILFWFLLLGPKYFLVLYFPIYLSNILFILHANLSTHVEREDGSIEVLDFSEGPYFKYANFVSFGSYYHKSHHLRPTVFNPSTIKNLSSEPYITYVPATSKNFEQKIKAARKLGLIQEVIYEQI